MFRNTHGASPQCPVPKKAVPTYHRLHKQSGQAVVTVYDNGRRKDMLLGLYGSPESKQEYERVIAALAAGKPAVTWASDITVNEATCVQLLAPREGVLPPRGRDGDERGDRREVRHQGVAGSGRRHPGAGVRPPGVQTGPRLDGGEEVGA